MLRVLSSPKQRSRFALIFLCLSLVLAGPATALGKATEGIWPDLWVSEWSTEFIINPQAGTLAGFLDFETAFSVAFDLTDWSFTSHTELDDAGWTDQTFHVAGSFGAYWLSSILDLDPAGLFESWEISCDVLFGEVMLCNDFELADLDTELSLGAFASTDLVDIGVEITFGDDDNDVCDLDWAGAVIDLSFPFCCADVSGSIAFDCDGFDAAVFEVSNIEIPNLPWVSIDATLSYELETKSLVLSPRLDFGPGFCFDLYVGANHSGNLEIDDIHFDGIGLTCNIGGVEFTGISYWGDLMVDTDGDSTLDAFPGILSPHGIAYWEGYRIATSDNACCGSYAFDVGVFFDATSSNLFDVSLIEAHVSVSLAPQVSITLGFKHDTAIGGLSQLEVGFSVPGGIPNILLSMPAIQTYGLEKAGVTLDKASGKLKFVAGFAKAKQKWEAIRKLDLVKNWLDEQVKMVSDELKKVLKEIESLQCAGEPHLELWKKSRHVLLPQKEAWTDIRSKATAALRDAIALAKKCDLPDAATTAFYLTLWNTWINSGSIWDKAKREFRVLEKLVTDSWLKVNATRRDAESAGEDADKARGKQGAEDAAKKAEEAASKVEEAAETMRAAIEAARETPHPETWPTYERSIAEALESAASAGSAAARTWKSKGEHTKAANAFERTARALESAANAWMLSAWPNSKKGEKAAKEKSAEAYEKAEKAWKDTAQAWKDSGDEEKEAAARKRAKEARKMAAAARK